MLKRYFIGGALAVITLGLVLFIVLRKSNSIQRAQATEAVPSNAVLFLDKADFNFFTEEFSETNLLWKELVKSSYFENFDSLLHVFKKGLTNMPLLSRSLEEEGLSLSLHLLGNNKIATIFYFTLDEDINYQSLDNEIKGVLGKDVLLNQRKYEAVELYDVSLNKANAVKSFSYVIKDGLLIVSRSSILLEDAVRSLNSGGGIYHLKGFKKVSATAGKYVPGNVYLNYHKLNHLLYPLVGSEFQGRLDVLSDLADWGEFDLDLNENILVFTGMTFAEDSMKGWLNVFKGQSPVRLEATSFIPSNAIDFMSLGISNVAEFKKQLKEELRLRNQLQNFQTADKKLVKLLGESPFNELLDMLNDEIVRFSMEANKGEGYEEVSIFEIRSRSEAMDKMERWVAVLAAEAGKELSDFTDKYILDTQTSYTLYDFPTELYSNKIFGKFIKSSFAFYDNYIIFSDSHEAISRTIYQNVLHKTLSNEGYYDEVNNLVSTKANLSIFIKPDPFIARYTDLIRKSVKGEIQMISGGIKKIPGLVIQFSNEDEMYYSSISLKYTQAFKEKALTVWESLLDSMAITKPVLVTNHNTSEKEIIVQDAKKSLYLVNSTGRVLWQLALDGPILSEIYQIDYYKNGKLQYLFSTAKGIYLLDRNGNNVERYPVKFRSDATNGIVLFDYDNRKDYRIFVACENRRLYVYDIEGNIVPGWSFGKTEGIVKKPVQHFRIMEKDYILFSDQLRTYILDRKGNERVSVKEKSPVSKNNLFYLDMNISEDKPRFVTTDTSGNVIGIDLSGEQKQILAHRATKGHFFRIKDLDRDGVPEFIYGNGNELEVINKQGKRIFSYKLKSTISSLPDIYEFSSSDLKIGLSDVEKNMIYLLNSDGSLYEGFPLEGNTRYSIGYFAGSDSRFSLIVGSQNGFLYNYSIE